MKKYCLKQPYSCRIKQREIATGSSSSRKTFYVVLDTTGWEEEYKVGDSLGIFPTNDPKEVDDIIQAVGGDAALRDFLLQKANIMRINRALVEKAATNSKKLQDLLVEENKQALSEFLHTHTLKELLHFGSLTKEQIIKHAMKLLPRFYSIANSQKTSPNELHLLVSHVQYQVNGQMRTGVGSHFLCFQAEVESTPIPIYVQPSNHFTIPANPDTPIILIGPGTGVAPFRAFLEERVTTKASGKNWLFFGERNCLSDFYYESFWSTLEKQGHLRLSTAFSRDGQDKFYVQHRMLQEKKELWNWIINGAWVYVCGDAKQMAKQVELTLCQIIKEEGNLTEQDSLTYFRNMRKEKRYLADVY